MEEKGKTRIDCLTYASCEKKKKRFPSRESICDQWSLRELHPELKEEKEKQVVSYNQGKGVKS